MFKAIRIAILLFILVNVALATVLTKYRSTDWKQPLRVVIYPLNGDRSEASAAYLANLSDASFEPIAVFMQEEARRYDVALNEPILARLGPAIDELPPAPPASGNPLAVMAWSLQLRYWAWRHDTAAGGKPDIRLFVLYHDPAVHATLAHSLGLEKGLIGVVNAFADRTMAGSNNMVITHEMLHTLGATDKYEPGSNLPRFPAGYAEPELAPRHPQRFAEIMAGRMAVSEQKAVIPDGLATTLIGAETAREIRWIK